MQRRTEPELMTGSEQVAAYSNADFDAPHSAIMRECYARHTLPDEPNSEPLVADLGCGCADIAIRLAMNYPRTVIHAFDGSQAMLDHARMALESAGVAARVKLQLTTFPQLGELGEANKSRYEMIVSNSLLHHLHDPNTMWEVVKRLASRNAKIFISDLRRPQDEAQAASMVEMYASGEPEILRHDFYNSLLAAFTADEVRTQLEKNDLPLSVEPLGDRHLIISGALA